MSLLFAALAAAAISVPTPEPVLRHAGRTLELPARLEVRSAAAPGKPDSTTDVTLVWRTWGAGLRAEAAGEGFRATVTALPGDGARVALDAEVRWLKPALVQKEVLRLSLRGPASAVGRDLAWAPVGKPLRVDRGTPAVLATREVLVDAAGFVAARYEAKGKRVEIDLVLDDAGAHPFKVLESCLTGAGDQSGPAARAAFARLAARPLALDRIARDVGDVSRGSASLWLLDPEEVPALPVIVERWPRGARAAVVFTDHADRTDPPALRAILYGTSDRNDPKYGKGGFSGNGIHLTKSFFARGGRGSLIEDPEASAIADELAATGSDVVPHSISPNRDERAVVNDGLGRFRRWGANTWIDHQPYTNCEAVASLGWRDDGEYGLRDLLVTHGYKWVWDMNDLSGYTALSNVFTVTPAGEPGPPIYPLPVDDRIWMFRSTWFYAAPGELGDALSGSALDKLERERGLFVGHTYLSATRRTTRAADLTRKIAVEHVRDGVYEIDDRLDAGLSRLGKRVRAGSTASLTFREAGERLLSLENVQISYLADGRVAIENCGTSTLEGLTLAVPGALELYVDGVEWFGLRPERDRTTVWFDLKAGGRVTMSGARHGRPFPFVRAPEAPLVLNP